MACLFLLPLQPSCIISADVCAPGDGVCSQRSGFVCGPTKTCVCDEANGFQSCTVSGQNSCINFNNDSLHCGSCNDPCPQGASCTDGECVCAGGKTYCETNPQDLCVDLQTNSQHCGRCNKACPSTQTCQAGKCLCPQSQPNQCNAAKGTICVDFATDRFNCGKCNNKCPPNQDCLAKRCVFPCEDDDDCRLFAPGQPICDQELSPPTCINRLNKWNWVHPFPTGGDLYGAAVSDLGLLLVGAHGNILRSSDPTIAPSHVNSSTRAQLNAVAMSGEIALAVGNDGTILRSTNAGQSWQTLSTTYTHHLKAVAISGDLAIIAGARRRFVEHPLVSNNKVNFPAIGDGLVLRSTDAGATWKQVAITNLKDAYSVAIADPQDQEASNDNKIVLVGSARAELYRSTNGGATLTLDTNFRDTALANFRKPGKVLETDDAASHLAILALAMNGQGALLAGEHRLTAVSQDSGETWNHDPLMKGQPLRNAYRGEVQMLYGAAIQGDKMFLVGTFLPFGENKGRGLLSTDGGKTWIDAPQDQENASWFATAAGPKYAIRAGTLGNYNYQPHATTTWLTNNPSRRLPLSVVGLTGNGRFLAGGIRGDLRISDPLGTGWSPAFGGRSLGNERVDFFRFMTRSGRPQAVLAVPFHNYLNQGSGFITRLFTQTFPAVCVNDDNLGVRIELQPDTAQIAQSFLDQTLKFSVDGEMKSIKSCTVHPTGVAYTKDPKTNKEWTFLAGFSYCLTKISPTEYNVLSNYTLWRSDGIQGSCEYKWNQQVSPKWERVNLGTFPNQGITAVLPERKSNGTQVGFTSVTPMATDGNVLALAGSYRSTNGTYTSNRLLISEDYGVTWRLSPAFPDTNANFTVTNIALQGTKLFVAGANPGAIFKSLDLGRTWQPRKLVDKQDKAKAIDISNLVIYDITLQSCHVAAITSAGSLLVSSDTGTTWTQLPNIQQVSYMQSIAMRPDGVTAIAGAGGVLLSNWRRDGRFGEQCSQQTTP